MNPDTYNEAQKDRSALLTIDGETKILQVTKDNRRRFTIIDNVLVCQQCSRMLQSRGRDRTDLVRLRHNDTSSILVNPVFLKPHYCLLSTLIQIESFSQGDLMDYDLYNSWMNANGGNYQLGNSVECMKLWDDFTHFVHNPPKRALPMRLLSPLSDAISLALCKLHGRYHVAIEWKKLKKKDDIKLANDIWSWSSKADQTKTSLSASDMLWHINKEPVLRKKYDKWSQLFSAHLTNVTATSLLVHMVGNVHFEKNASLLMNNKFCCLDTQSYSNVFKALSVALRRTGHWPDGTPASLDEVTSCSGWELAIGRSENKSDWADEENKRTQQVVNLGPPTSKTKDARSNAMYCSMLARELEVITSELVKAPKRHQSWREYVEERQSWVSSGSTGGKRIKLNDGSSVRVNKHVYFEQLTADEMTEWLDSEPKMVATASEKFEMGKARAIYGTEPCDYSIASYALSGIEEKLYHVDGVESGLTGLDYVVSLTRRLANVKGQRNTECTMIDYSDFNYQHTLEAQSLVFEKLSARLRVMGYHADKAKASDWISASLLNQWCRFPGPNRKEKRISQGMFSGCRGTNFINTILNVAYYRVAMRWLQEHLNLTPIAAMNIHQGDDVWITNHSRVWAIAMYEVMSASGLIFQPSKQMFDINRGEFLRVVYTPQGCKGYLARAIGTLIMKPIQNTDVVAPAERANALNSQIMILMRRGFTWEGCRLLWRAVVPYAARAKLVQGAITIPVGYLRKSHIDGGLDLGEPMTSAGPSHSSKTIPAMSLCSTALEAAVPTNMSEDWIKIMSKKLKRNIDYESLIRVLHASNVTDSLRQEDRMLCLRQHERDLRKWLENLEVGTVVRDRLHYDALFEGETASSVIEYTMDCVEKGKYGKTTQEGQGVLGCIMAAIGSSAYKSISNARTATGLPTIEAALVAISACEQPTLSVQAAALLSDLRTRLGDEALAEVLGGIRSGATKYEGEFHPIILSWVEGRSNDEVLITIISGASTVETDIKRTLNDRLDCYVRSLRKFNIFGQISKF